MAGVAKDVPQSRLVIIERPRLTRLLDSTESRVRMLVAPAGYGKTTLAQQWSRTRTHTWYSGTNASADVAALAARLSSAAQAIVPHAGERMVARMRATGTPEHEVDLLADLFTRDLGEWPSDAWLVFDDYQYAMESEASERFVDLLVRQSPINLLLTSRKRPSWATSRRLLYGEVFEVGRSELAMDHGEAAQVLVDRRDRASGLVALAEGWPAVIGLAALTRSQTLPESGLPDALYEYLAEELYQAATPDLRWALCQLALPPKIGDGVPEFLFGEKATVVLAEATRLGFLQDAELHPLLRTFLDTKARERANEISDVADGLGMFLVEHQRWDDAFSLVSRFFRPQLFVTLLEIALQSMLSDARLMTLEGWLVLGEERRMDEPVVD